MRRTRTALLGLCTLTTTAIGGACLAASLETIYVHGAFETAGVIAHLSADADGDETASLEYRGPGDADFRQAHDFVMYDAQNLASSLFGLSPGTTYELRVTLADPDGVSGGNPQVIDVTTLAPFALPVPQATVIVASSGGNFTSIQAALDAAQPGDEIRVRPGVYGAIGISNLNPPAGMPIVVRADESTDRPIIDGNGGAGTAVNITGSSNLIFDGLVIRNAGSDASGIGVNIQASSAIVVRNSLIHDNGRYNVFVTDGDQFPGGATLGGFHLIESNEIADLQFDPCGGATNSACPNQTSFGIRLDNNPGAGTVIRGNVIHGHVDNTVVCGDEGAARSLGEDIANVLALTGGSDNQGWTNHNLDFYDNRLFDARDDDVEGDGICVNARFFRNEFGAAQNPVSVSPALPGPYFFVRNLIQATGEASIKFNTAASPSNSIDVPAIRNIFFYHNTIARSNNGTVLNLWYAVPNDHNVPVKNIVFRNNVFWATQGGRLIDANNRGNEHPSFDYDLWYTTNSGNVFEWWDGNATLSAGSLSEFQQISQQESNGLFGDPGLDTDLRPLAGAGASLVVDRGVVLPGINDDFSGAAPDLGAFESGSAGPPGDPGTLQFTDSVFTTDESAGTISLFVTRIGGNSGSVSVSYASSDGSATAGTDYTGVSGTLTWADGDADSKSFTLSLIDDSTVEGQESVDVELTDATGGAILGAPANASVLINDDDDSTGGGSSNGGGGGGPVSPFVILLLALLVSGRPTLRRGEL